MGETSSAKNASRRKAMAPLVVVAVVAAILVGVLVPFHEKRARSSSVATTPGAAGTVQPVDKAAAATTTGIDIGSIAAALADGNKVQKPIETSAAAPVSAGEASPSAGSGSGSGSGSGGFFSGLNGAATQGGAAALAPPSAISISSGAWKALKGAGGTVCRPKNGTELVQMVTRSPCTLIVLQPSMNYNVTKTMNVTSTKIVMGHPIFPPILTPAKGVHRLFDVQNGGRLDLRAMQLIKGDPEKYDQGTLRVAEGNTVRVLLGGDFSASWCIFTQPAQTIEGFLRDLDNPRNRIRTFGGFVLVLGGTLRLIGVIMYRFQPFGMALVNNVQIGRDVLVVAGNAVLAGWYSCMGNLMTASINVGMAAAVLGGTMTWAGGAVANAGVVNCHWGAGQLAFVGGGTMVTVGVHNVGGMLAIMRSGFGQFGVGAGALLHIGHLQPRAWGVANVWNAGQTHACGAGLLHKHGENIATTAISHVFAGAGAHMFLGSGDCTWVGVSAGRSTLTQSLSGVGGIFYNGAGSTNFIGLPSAGFAGARVRFMLGGDLFSGGGTVEWINYKRFNGQIVDAFFGLGTNVFLGGGGVVFVNSNSRTVRRRLFSFPKSPGAIWVGGTKVSGATTNKDIYATGQGITFLNGHNKTMRHDRRQMRHFMGRNRRVPMQQRRRQDAVSPPTVTAVATPAEARRSSLLLIRSSFEEELGGDLLSGQQLVAALRGMDEVGALIDQLDADKGETSPTQLAVPENTQCLVCGDAPVEQVGQGACQVSDACTVAKPGEALLQAQVAPAAGGTELPPVTSTTTDLLALADKDGSSVGPLPDLFYMAHELGVFCDAGEVPTGACVSEAEVKQAAKAWLAAAVGKDSGFSVAAASTAIPAAVAHLAGEELLSATHKTRRTLEASDAATVGCATEGVRFNVYVTTVDEAMQEPLREAWAAAVSDPEPLRAAVGACALAVTRKAAIVYPPIERMEPFQPQGLGLVGPSVVVGSGSAIAPVDHVVRGQSYRLFLQNFPGGSPTEVRLVSASDALAAGGRLEGVPLATVGSFDDDGVTELAWTVGEALPEGQYYLRASSGPGGAIFATSQPFSVVAAPLTGAARRLRFG